MHAYADGRRLVLGGVHIPHDRGLAGHSDADVLTHALVDALLGAAGLGDIGERFPDTEERYRGASSLGLLAATAELVQAAGYQVVNVDAVIVAQAPRLQPHLQRMAGLLAQTLGLPPETVNVKATSPEGLGALGAGDGVAAQAVALLDRAIRH
jgi:2-C-methyl-D-erythritol 2,4-cyclodiphosphate synthase